MNRIKELRQKKELTQKELATMLKLNQTAIGKYERGELEPCIATLQQLADIFDCSIDYIVGRKNNLDNCSNNITLSKDNEEMLQLYNALSEDVRSAFKEAMKQIVAKQK